MEICYSTDDLSTYLEPQREGRPRAPAAARPLPRERDRGRRRRARRRRPSAALAGVMQHVEEAGVHSGDSACVLPPMSLGEEMLERIARDDEGDGARARRHRADQHPVRGRRRRALRDRGEPAGLADGALRQQGDRRADREDRLPADARREARRPATCRRCRRATSGQGGGAAVQPVRRRRHGPRAGDEEHRRGDGRGRGLPDGVREGAGGGRDQRCRGRGRSSSPSPTATRRPRRSSRPASATSGFRIVATAGPPRRSRGWACRSRRSTRSRRARRTWSTTSSAARSTW